MSTISLPHEKQIRHFFVADTFATHANIATFISSAPVGAIEAFTVDGLRLQSGGAAGKDFYIAKKNYKGTISKSDIITANKVKYLKGSAPRGKAGKSQTFELSGAPDVGAEVRLSGKVHYGNSEENFITFVVGAKMPASGGSATTILTDLAKQMAGNLAESVHTSSRTGGQVGIAGNKAAGTVVISGTAGTISSIKVGNVELLSATITNPSTAAATGPLVVANINASSDSTGFTASGSGATVTITSNAPGTQFNGAVVTSVAAGGTTTVDTDLTGGTSTTAVKDNKYFTISVDGSKLIIKEKDWILEDFRPGLRTHDQLMWNFEVQGDDTVMSTVTKTNSAPIFAAGQGYQVMELERYLVGHRAETTPFLDSTLGFGRPLESKASEEYYMLDSQYFAISRDDPKHSDKMLTVASTDKAVINALGAIYGAAAGASFSWTAL